MLKHLILLFLCHSITLISKIRKINKCFLLCIGSEKPRSAPEPRVDDPCPTPYAHKQRQPTATKPDTSSGPPRPCSHRRRALLYGWDCGSVLLRHPTYRFQLLQPSVEEPPKHGGIKKPLSGPRCCQTGVFDERCGKRGGRRAAGLRRLQGPHKELTPGQSLNRRFDIICQSH